MTSINRRQLIAGTAAILGEAHLPMAFATQKASKAEGGKVESLSGPPKNLLSSTFSPDLLSKTLLPASTWHPYPKVDERDVWQSVPKNVAEAIVQRAEAVLGTEWVSLPAKVWLEFKRTGNRSDFEHLYFTRRQRLGDLVLGECIEGKGRFLDEIVTGTWLICEETFWGIPACVYLQRTGLGSGLPDVAEPVVDLFAAETASCLSWVHYLLEPRLDKISPLITQRIRTEAKRRILDPALERDDFWWMWGGVEGKGHLNNWNPWINSNWMVTNLILEQNPAQRLEAMSKMCKSLDRYLSDYSADGGGEEGPAYWGVSAASYLDCCATLASATGGAANVLTHPFLKKMEHFIADVHIADEFYVNYGDARAKAAPSAELAWRIGSGVGDNELEAFGAYSASIAAIRGGASLGSLGRLTRALPDLLAAGKAMSAQKADALGRDSWYPDLGLMTTRVKAGTSNGFYLAVQAAANQRPHGHNDSGSFIVFHNGDPVFIDVGVEAYTAKTFSEDRYSIWAMQSAFHNLPTVGGVMQSAKATYRASDLHYANDDAHAGLSMNLATAYPAEAGIVNWLRNISLDRKANRILLNEEFQLQRKAPVALSFMTPRVPSQGPKGSIVLTAVDKSAKDVSLKYDASLIVPNFEKIVLEDESLQQTWGKTIYRVLLTSVQPIDGGKWTIEIA